MGKKKSGTKTDIIGELTTEGSRIATGVYFFIIFCVFPLYHGDHYWEIANHKWHLYLYATVGYIIITLLISLPSLFSSTRRKEIFRIKFCDIPAFIYGALVLLSFLFALDKRIAWNGMDGWYMGTLAQLLFLLSYFAVSRSRISVPFFLISSGAGSAICIVIGILQRLGWDFLHLYYGMPDEVVRDFLSTVGNRTWFSGYLCVILPIGIYLFWEMEGYKSKILSGVYLLLVFAGISVNYSDSAIAALMVILFVLFILSIGNAKKLQSFFEVCCLWFSACLFMGILLRIFQKSARPARGLSAICLNIKVALIGFVLTLGLVILFRFLYNQKQKNNWLNLSEIKIRKTRFIVLGVTAAAGIFLVAFILLNTTGVLERWFHFTAGSYLYFNDNWGDYRGWIWKMVCRMFSELPLPRKLIGVGADNLAYYGYGIPQYASLLKENLGEAILTNAHNEWLTAVFSFGLLGGAAYLYLFIHGAICCFQNAAKQVHPLVVAVGLSICSYIVHNFFCYQQICATAPVFILLGIAGALLRDPDSYKNIIWRKKV